MSGLCRTYLTCTTTSTRALIYFILVIFLSVFNENEVWDTMLASKSNPLNVYLVKWSWAWTSAAVGGYLLTRACVASTNGISTSHLTRIFLQIALGTSVWYLFAVQLFSVVEEGTGVCKLSEYNNKRECRKAGYTWSGFDISGHCFLLLWNILFTLENIQHPLSSRKEENVRGKSRRSTFETISLVQLYFISLLTMIWEVMLISTALHFHTTAEKVFGCLVALFAWILIYRILPVPNIQQI